MNKRLLSMFLVLCMVVTMLPVSVMAEEIYTTIDGSEEIISFAPLTETVKEVSLGTTIEDLEMPETLTATVRKAVFIEEDSVQDIGSLETAISTTATKPEWEETTVDIPVTWESQPSYDPDTEGEYIFTPVIAGYMVSALPPKITITVDMEAAGRGAINPLADDSYDIWVGGVQVTEENKNGITGNGITGTVIYDPTSSTLTLNGATITEAYEGTPVDGTTSYYGIYAATTKLNIVLVGSNTVTGKSAGNIYSAGIHTSNALTISGSGNLGVTGGTGAFSVGIRCMGNLTISNGTITATSARADYTSIAIYSGGEVTILDGLIEASANTTTNISYGIIANSGYTIIGGTVNATGKIGMHANQTYNPVTISGCVINATGTQTGIVGALTVTEGTVMIRSDRQALYGRLDVLGGTVTASINEDGSDAHPYDVAQLASYKYLNVVTGPADVAKNTTTGTGYATLQDAFNAVEDGQTILLLSNISLTTTVTVANGVSKSFEIDLNGKTLDGGSVVAITHKGTGAITIKGSGTVKSNNYDTFEGAINNQGTGSIIVSGGTVQGNQTAIFNQQKGTIIITGGTVSGVRGIFNNSGGTVNISGGTVQSTGSSGNAIYTNEGGNITISDNAYLTSANTKTDDATISLWFSNYFRPITLTIYGGTIENTAGGNAIRRRGDSSGKLIANVIIPDGKLALIKGGSAMNFAPTLVRATVTASANFDGSEPISYNAADIINYKNLKFEPGPDTVVSNLDLTDKLTAPVMGATPEESITDDQYTGKVTWNDTPTKFLGSTAYTATITLTAIDGYTFSGVENNAFTYIGATSVTNIAGSGNTLSVTITFPQTVVKTLQQIIITTAPTKTAYYYGETFDKAGMVVKAVYNNGTVDVNFTDYTVNKTGPLTLSDTIITLTGNSTTIKATQSITISKKTPTAVDLYYSLTAVDYDGTAKPVSVAAGSGKTLGTIIIKYDGSTTAPINAGSYAVTVDIDGNAEYNAVTGLYLGSYTINKITYTGTTTVLASVLISGQIEATITLPILPPGANYGTPIAGGIIMMTGISIVGITLTYTAPASTAGQTGIMTIPVTGATNYNDYSIVVTVTSTERLFNVTVTNGTGSGSYAESVTVTITANDRSGYTFTGWSGADVTFADASQKTTTFTMPAKAVTVTANYRQNSSGNDGDGGSSGGSSSNDNSSPVIVTPPTPDKPNSPTQGEIKVPGKVDKKGNITVKITNKTVTEAFNKALADAKKNGNEQNGITLLIRVDTGSKSGSNVTINLPKTVQDTIIAKKIVNTILVVDNPNIRIGMDLATVQEINKQAKSDVNITAARANSGKLTGDAKKAIGSRPVFDLKVNYGKGKTVNSFGSGSVSVTIPYTLGINEKAGNIQAVYVDAKGKVHWIVNSVYDTVKQVLRFSTNHFSTYGVGYKQDNTTFKDIADHWAKKDIEFVISRGLLNSISTTAFSLNSAITRGMFVTALGRLANVDVRNYKESSFTDVKKDAYYMGYIEWASKNNIVSGTGDGKFAPDQSITREQMAVIIQNYSKVIGFTLPKVYMENTFTDSEKISTYAKEAIKKMQMAGIIIGKNGNLFDPQGIATRAEVSAVLRRLVELSISSDTMQGWTVNDSGGWMYYENGKPITGKKDINGTTYSFDQYGVSEEVPKI